MSLIGFITAFLGGIFACVLGACQTFVFAGFIGLVGMVYAMAQNIGALASPEVAAIIFPEVANGSSTVMDAVLSNFGVLNNELAFGAFFGPGIVFTAPIFAGAYARYKRYIKEEDLRNYQCWVPLLDLRRVDVLFVGALGGVFGYLVMGIITLCGIGIDGHATAILLSCIICKLVFERKLVSKIPEDEAKYGSRFNPNCMSTGWLPYTRVATIRLAFGVSLGALIGYLYHILGSNPVSFAWSHCIGFFLGGALLIFLMMGFNIIPAPPAFVPACFVLKGMVIVLGNTPEAVAAVPVGRFMLWGAAFGTLGIFFADFVIQILEAGGRHYMDPPSVAIMCGSFIGLTVIAKWFPSCVKNDILPIVVLSFFVVYTVVEYIRFKDTPAYKTKLYL